MEIVQIELPIETATKLEQMAQQEQKTVSDLVQALLNEHRPSPQLPPDVEAELDALTHLTDDALKVVAQNTLSRTAQEQLAHLNYKAQTTDPLTPVEKQEQEILLAQYDRALLRRTKALHILRNRGHDLDQLLSTS